MNVDTVPAKALEMCRNEQRFIVGTLEELLFAIDASSEIGPASRVLPRWQIEKIEELIERFK